MLKVIIEIQLNTNPRNLFGYELVHHHGKDAVSYTVCTQLDNQDMRPRYLA